jgi:hypothetical protein
MGLALEASFGPRILTTCFSTHLGSIPGPCIIQVVSNMTYKLFFIFICTVILHVYCHLLACTTGCTPDAEDFTEITGTFFYMYGLSDRTRNAAS